MGCGTLLGALIAVCEVKGEGEEARAEWSFLPENITCQG